MTVLDPTALDRLREYAAADLDHPDTRANVTDLVLRLLPDVVDTIEYWQTVAMERFDGIDHATAWPLCRCERDLTCQGCDEVASECDCSSISDEIAEAVADDAATEAELARLDPLTRVLLGHPSRVCAHDPTLRHIPEEGTTP